MVSPSESAALDVVLDSAKPLLLELIAHVFYALQWPCPAGCNHSIDKAEEARLQKEHDDAPQT